MSKILDLFSGCGGFSLSAKMAGFEVVTSIDIDPDITSKYEINFPDSNLLLTDISKLNGNSLLQKIGSRPDGIIGGPPCQGFSLIGRRQKNDPRNALLYHYFRIVKELQPAFFIMENVPGLMSSESKSLLDEGLSLISGTYNIAVKGIFNAADYGAATNRKRFIVTGYNPHYVDKPDAWKRRPKVSVKEAISDLPHLRNLKESEDGQVYGAYRDNPSMYASQLRKIPRGISRLHPSIPWLSSGYVSGCATTQHTVLVERRFARVKPGESDSISRYVRLRLDEPSITLRAGTGRDKGSYQAARPIHPSCNRVITVREAARIQGFPDWFIFHPTIWHSFRMIGNSVSPMLGKAALESFKGKIE